MYIFTSRLAPSVQFVWFWAMGWDTLGGDGLHLGPCALSPSTKTKFIPTGLTQYGGNDSNNSKEFDREQQIKWSAWEDHIREQRNGPFQ